MFPDDKVPMIKGKVLEPHFTQISSSTPFTAAIVADLMDRYPFYKWHPEVVKALLITFTESNITKVKRYRIAISWLSNGTYVYESGNLPQDINLIVRQNGSVIASSKSIYNPFELVDFVAKNDGDLEITIDRYTNRGGRVLLGYNLVEIQ